ncbi:hypothetical protein AGLY_016509 [Aphis glycines]|uniref:Uncharacterized protein n=1 Tax=Aphis glycines TaxID=307491 RepID=A0A6G0SXN7_APHGL|nr:hypothetical protein AGLY_016509 [Aphis glycines]
MIDRCLHFTRIGIFNGQRSAKRRNVSTPIQPKLKKKFFVIIISIIRKSLATNGTILFHKISVASFEVGNLGICPRPIFTSTLSRVKNKQLKIRVLILFGESLTELENCVILVSSLGLTHFIILSLNVIKQKFHYMPRLLLGNDITRLTFIGSTCIISTVQSIVFDQNKKQSEDDQFGHLWICGTINNYVSDETFENFTVHMI